MELSLSVCNRGSLPNIESFVASMTVPVVCRCCAVNQEQSQTEAAKIEWLPELHLVIPKAWSSNSLQDIRSPLDTTNLI